MKMFKCLVLFCFVIVMNGCAANMALTKGQNSVDISKESIALVSVKVSNQNKMGYQPDLINAFFFAKSDDAEKKYFGINNDSYKSVKNQYNEYLLSFSLKPGKYNFAAIWGNYKIPLLVNAMCVLPLNTEIEVKSNTVIYLGKIDAVIRERKIDSEERAGGLIPLLDQSLAGFSSGTFDINYKDNYDEDMKAFIAEYPGLQNVKVEKSILSTWKRPENMVAKAP